jgi:hypothetical protein
VGAVGAKVVTGACVRSALFGNVGWWADSGAMGPLVVAVGLLRVEVVGTCRGTVAGAEPYRCMFFLSGHLSLKA